MTDYKITCHECSTEFKHAAGDQAFYADRSFKDASKSRRDRCEKIKDTKKEANASTSRKRVLRPGNRQMIGTPPPPPLHLLQDYRAKPASSKSTH